MKHLKELHVRSHVMVGLGHIYGEHLHEAVAGTRTATLLKDRAATIARYEENVRRFYPEERFGNEKGGLSDELTTAAAETVKRARAADDATCFEFKNANPENPAAASPEELFDNIRPVSIVEDADAQHVVDHDLQVKSGMANVSDFHVRMKADMEMQSSFEPKYNSLISPSTYNYMARGPEFLVSIKTSQRRAGVVTPKRLC